MYNFENISRWKERHSLDIKDWSGLIAATFTPMQNNGELNISAIPSIVSQLLKEGAAGLYVCGGTGEGTSLTNDERMAVAEAYISAANGKVPVFIHVGQDSLFAARELAKHAMEICLLYTSDAADE